MNRFYFGGSNSSGSDLDDDNLPYPKPLARSAFLTSDFDPTAFLSSLHNRHQTLEDLRAELRTRSQDLNKELLDLVNDNYQDFLSLGGSLKGGEEKVEEVRVGLLGFKGDIEALKSMVKGRTKEVEGLIEERRRIRKDVQLGRGLLEVNQRLEELEERLMVTLNGSHHLDREKEEELEFDDSEDESEDEGGGNPVSVSRLQKRVQQYIYVTRLMKKIGVDHPFMVRQEERVVRLRQALLLDLKTVLNQHRGESEQDKERALRVIGMYRDMDESKEALKLLHEHR